jgi:formylglycine-generating enzyme required for sulfatase activity
MTPDTRWNNGGFRVVLRGIASGLAVPAAPGSIGVIPGDRTNTIAWDSVATATSYNLYWTSDGSSPSKTHGAKHAAATSPYSHSGLVNGTTYRYVVTAQNAAGEGAESGVASGTPRTAGTPATFGGIAFVWIPPGTFQMGSTNGGVDEVPVHAVQITRGFWMSKYEITQAQYSNVVGANPSYFRGASLPVEQVSWYDCSNFCELLSAQTGMTVRLPTEAEREYACRAGTTTEYNVGSSLSTNQANYWDSGLNATRDVGSYAPNAWGLCDMHGNVWEWCQDWYGSGYYATSPPVDPLGPLSGTWRVVRGGGWDYDGNGCRSADRDGYDPGGRDLDGGFRVVSPGP